MSNAISAIPSAAVTNNFQKNSKKEADTIGKLSTGKKINKASDDVVGSNKAQNLEKAVRGLEQASKNASKASSVVSTAEGGLTQTMNNLQSLRELAVRAADENLSAADRDNIVGQAREHINSVDNISEAVQVDGQKLLDGSFQNKAVQVGDGPSDQIEVSIDSASTKSLGVNEVDLSSSSGASDAITAIDNAIKQVGSQMTELSSKQERLDNVTSQNAETSKNVSEAKSAVEDLDYAQAVGALQGQQIKKQFAATLINQAGKTASDTVQKIVGS